MNSRSLAVIVPVLAALLGACASGPDVPPGTACEITAARAPFYKFGPAQTFGADDMLAAGTRVTLIKRAMGFSRVMQNNGVTGYVSNDDLRPAAAESTPKPGSVVTNRKLDKLFTGPARRSAVKPTPGDPLFDVNDVPLPVKEEPPPAPPPEKKPEQ
ncbi:MAG: SH3 domain-containing protein [Chthoniobacteraceae bacterium]